MRKKFIVALDNNNGKQDKIFADYINGYNAGFWHWFADLWIINDPDGKLTVTLIRDKLRELNPYLLTMIFEVPSECKTWTGLGIVNSQKDYFEWMYKNWDK